MPPVGKTHTKTPKIQPYKPFQEAEGWTPGVSQVVSGLAAMSFAPAAAAAAPPPAYDECIENNDNAKWAILPYFYKKEELEKFYTHPKEVQKYLKTPVPSSEIGKEYMKNAEKAKADAIPAALDLFKDRFRTYPEEERKPLIQDFINFYSEMTILTKQNLHTVCRKGFKWVDGWLKSEVSEQGTHRPWAFLTENFVDTHTSIANTTKHGYAYPQYAIFKSTEWIENLYRYERPPECVIECRTIAQTAPAILQKHGFYVLMDDAAYSGQQKAALLAGMIDPLLRYGRNATVLLMIPYMTDMAMDRFRMNLLDYQKRNAGYCNLLERRFSEEIMFIYTTTANTNTLTIRVWTGGKKIEESAYLLEHRVLGEPGLTKEMKERRMDMFHKVILGERSYGGFGATLTLLEHKIPDFLSFNTMLADAFRRQPAMKAHYAMNPPYKLKFEPSGPAQKGGIRRVARRVKHLK